MKTKAILVRWVSKRVTGVQQEGHADRWMRSWRWERLRPAKKLVETRRLGFVVSCGRAVWKWRVTVGSGRVEPSDQQRKSDVREIPRRASVGEKGNRKGRVFLTRDRGLFPERTNKLNGTQEMQQTGLPDEREVDQFIKSEKRLVRAWLC